jgi:purine catabolism regulator
VSVPLSLRELLALPTLRAARPAVLSGAGELDRPVRWVHSSELYEIGPLLAGGELLLTTGLGLAGVDPGARRHYLRELAGREVAGLAMELGRTFPEVPAELVDEAVRAGFPLIALRVDVPFIRISEEANTAIVDESARRLRRADTLTTSLNEALLAGAGTAGLLRIAAGRIGLPLVLVAAGGALVAAHGVNDDRAAWDQVAQASARVPVVIGEQVWGTLAAGPTGSGPTDSDTTGSGDPGGEPAHPGLTEELERAATALALTMLHAGGPVGDRDRQAATLLADLVGGVTVSRADAQLRAGLAGFRPTPGQRLVAVAVDAPQPGPAVSALDRCARALGTPALRARVRLSVFGLLTVPAGTADPVGAVRTAVQQVTDRSGAPQLTVALGPAVPADADPAELAASLHDARAALSVAVGTPLGRPGSRPLVTTSRELTMEIELMRTADRNRWAELVARTIGPVADWDATHGSTLVATLEVYLRHGCSPTRTSTAVHLGRQTLYQRLRRIETLLGHPADDADLHPALLLATCAHRLLTLRSL